MPKVIFIFWMNAKKTALIFPSCRALCRLPIIRNYSAFRICAGRIFLAGCANVLECLGDDKAAICALGEEVVTDLCQRLLDGGAPGLHFYTMNQAAPTLAIWHNLNFCRVMLSVIIICKNEALHIRRCLESVRWADEIIVLDSGSSDNTVELCRAYTEKVFVNADWQGFGIQKQRALEKASGDWIFSIDADEQVTPQLQAEIENAILNTEFAGFAVPRLSSYCGREMKHSGWYPDYVLRLFKREHAHFSPDVVHERVIVDGKVGKLTQPLLHEAFINAEEVLDKINRYSSLGAEKLYQADRRTSLSEAVLKAVWTFIRTYFLQRGFLDGRQGFMLAVSNAEGAYYKYLKLLLLTETKQNESC
jgi:hypothetical protein